MAERPRVEPGRRRFWREAATVGDAAGFEVHLDGRPVRTPAKAPLRLPTRGLAELVAFEWASQGDTVEPATMPATRTANTAIDRVAPNFADIAGQVVAFGHNDLLCYRADGPTELIERERAAWDPLLDWAARSLGARLICAEGVMHVAQPDRAVAALTEAVSGLSAFELAAMHEIVTLSGSLVIGLALHARHAPPADLWAVSRVDEIWQEERWGEDAEARGAAAEREAAFLDAARFLLLASAREDRPGVAQLQER